MFSVKVIIAAGALAAISTAAFAADLGGPPPFQPPPPIMEAPSGGWYLRGDIGVGLDSSTFTYLPNPLHAPVDVLHQNYSTADTLFFNGGIGYEVNNWLRFDVTGEYRSKTNIDADIFYRNGGVFGDQYQGYLRSAVFLANAYIDLGTWWCVTPFVGAGVGGAYNIMDNLTDVGVGTTGSGIGRNSANWNLAWAGYAGFDFNVTQNFLIELSYRYLSYGSVTDTIDCAGGCAPDSYKFGNLTSQDIMLGFRFRLQPEAPAPLMPPPPLNSRG